MLFIRERSAHRIDFVWTAKNWYFILDPIHFVTTWGSHCFCSVWLTCGIRGAIWLEFLVIASYGINIDNTGGQRGIESRPDQTSRLFQKRLRLTAGPISQSLFVNSVELTTSATLFAPCAHEEWLPACVLETQWSCGLLYFLQQMWLADQKQPNETGRSVPKGGKRSLRTRLQSAISQRKCCWMLEK